MSYTECLSLLASGTDANPPVISERTLRWLARLEEEAERQEAENKPLPPVEEVPAVPIHYQPASQRHRELVRNVVSSCCEALVYRQVYQRERMLPTATHGPAATLLKRTVVDEWFYQCSACQDRCNIELCFQRIQVPQALVYGSAAYLFQFLAWYRKQRFCAILPGTEVEGEIHRYVDPRTAEQRASIRTDQKRCPVRLHERNSLVLRFNLTQRVFAVCCWCSQRPFDSRPLEIIDPDLSVKRLEDLRQMDAEIQEWYKD